MTRARQPALLLAVGAGALSLVGAPARGQFAYFSATGTFTEQSGQTHDFRFNTPVTSSMLFRTWAHGGGTNAAGQQIPPGGIDSIITLYTGAGGFLDESDDIGAGQKDSRLIMPALPAGDYRLRLRNFKTVIQNGAWAVDLVNNSGNLTLTSAVGSANSTMHTLALGGEDGGFATLPIDASTSPTISHGLIANGGGAIAISGNGTVTFAGPVSGLGRITGGATKRFNHTASGGGLATAGSTVVGPAGALTASYVRENMLSVEGSVQIIPSGTADATSRVNALTLGGGTGAWTGKLDLTNNALVIDHNGASPLDTVRDQLRFAANDANTGGIFSSLGAGYGVGYAEAAQLATVPPIFGTVDATAVLARGTRLGDANLDGTVNLTDFNRLASNFGSTTAVWTQGDFNHDGQVNLTDFNRLASNFGLSASGPEVTPEDWSALAGAVPEPGSLALAYVGLGWTVCRRRRGTARPLRLGSGT